MTAWPTVPFWSVAQRMERTDHPDAELLSVYRDWGVIRKADRDDNFNKASEDLSTYKYVEQGNLVLNKMKTWQGSLGVSPYDGIVSPAYFVCSISPEIHGRFLHHLLRSHTYIAKYEAASKGIRTNQWDLPYEELRQIPILRPGLDDQRRIADFLDDRVARIDQIIAARRGQIATVQEQLRSIADELLPRADASWTRLGLFLRGIEQGWSPQCDAIPAEEGEWGVIKVGAVQPGWFQPLENKRLPDDLSPMPEYELSAGDLLVSRANTPERVGFFAVVPDGVRRGLILCDKVMRVRVDDTFMPEFVSLVGQSRRTRDALIIAGTGTSGSMVNIRGDDLRDLRVPLVSPALQQALVQTWLKGRERTQEVSNGLVRSIELLSEYKQSLITAAVTGEIDVTTARSGIPG